MKTIFLVDQVSNDVENKHGDPYPFTAFFKECPVHEYQLCQVQKSG